MAGGKIQKLKKRMITVSNAEKITKAMGLVATAKLGSAREKITKSRPYFEILRDSLEQIVAQNREFSSPYLQKRAVAKTGVMVIGGDRGMAGSFHSRLFQMAVPLTTESPTTVFPIGKKSVEYFQSFPDFSIEKPYLSSNQMGISDCFELSHYVCHAFLEGHFDQFFLVYTQFTSMLEQTPIVFPVLPLLRQEKEEPSIEREKSKRTILYEPSSEVVYDAIVPEYVAGLLYGALCESRASELSARHNAMDTASKNAKEMEEKLHLQYNRERQGQITQEITEIIAGTGEL